MKHFTPDTATQAGSAQTPDCERTDDCHANKNGERRVGVDGFDDNTHIFDSFHPADTPLWRDDAGSGVSSTVTHPAGELWHHDSPRALKLPLAVSPTHIADAKAVVANPDRYHDRPLLRRLAWMTLMTARGCEVHQNRLAQMPVEGLS
ncbi:hypothetical protein JI58_04260 [Marinosulfonomonas sp. PRT-SC04]|nr:hypothetical protein JI58_05210 [Marinosulfonomonas sp. PRT-SC04]KPU84358.1 hypothetical protein JI58_04260 [Marinosulfonomonas sp. PRT-SC04]